MYYAIILKSVFSALCRCVVALCYGLYGWSFLSRFVNNFKLICKWKNILWHDGKSSWIFVTVRCFLSISSMFLHKAYSFAKVWRWCRSIGGSVVVFLWGFSWNNNVFSVVYVYVGLLCVVVQVAGVHVFVCMWRFDGDFATEKCAGCKYVFVVWLFNKSIFIVDIFQL